MNMDNRIAMIFFALCLVTMMSGAKTVYASEKVIKGVAVQSSAYIPKSIKKQGVNQENIEKALDFIIPKDMAKKLNSIQWYFKAGKNGRQVLSGNRYQLMNMAIEQSLKRQKRAKAANLGFQKKSSKNFNMLVQREKGNGVLRYGDVVALNLNPYGWLRYKKQGRFGGINLSDDDNNPHYIWKITGGKVGTMVLSGMPFALYNLKPIQREIIFCQRAYGIDLGWRGKSKCGSKLAKISGAVFGANGALSGEGLTGKLAKKWKHKLCKTAVGAAAVYATGQTGGVGGVAVSAASAKAIKKCNEL